MTRRVNLSAGQLTQGLQRRNLVRSAADSVARLAETRAEVANQVTGGPIARHVRDLTRPNSVSKTMRNVGMALIVSPDIVTDPIGAALVAGSYAMKKKDPTKIDDLTAETKKILRDIQGLSL